MNFDNISEKSDKFIFIPFLPDLSLCLNPGLKTNLANGFNGSTYTIFFPSSELRNPH